MRVIWEVDDGYADGSAPHSTIIDDDDLSDYENDREREDFITDCIQEDFEQKVSWIEIRREE